MMASESTEAAKVDGAGERTEPEPDGVRRDLEEQFNVQRARMKDLFLQKEEDLQQIKQEREQLQSEVAGLRAELQQLQILSGNQQSELQNLQLLVSETVEVSSSGQEEVRMLRGRNAELEHQLQILRHQMNQQEMSLVPATLVRSLARRLGAEPDPETVQPRKRENVEDGELMQSILQPMDLEITALKAKLRETDAQLQEALKWKPSDTTAAVTSSGQSTPSGPSGPGGPGGPSRACDMCANYERQLVAEQTRADTARDSAQRLHLALNMAKEELEGVRSMHDETAHAWQAARTEMETAIQELRAAGDAVRIDLAAHAHAAKGAHAHALHAVTTLTVDREELQKKLDSLERDNEILIGTYTKKAEEMQNEIIDLPNTVEALQEYALQVTDQLIKSAIGRERAMEDAEELRRQLQQHTAQLVKGEELANAREAALKETRDKLEQLQAERGQLTELAEKLRNANDVTERLLEDKKRLQAESGELRLRVAALQQELDNSEDVQRDFVRLSQSLQVQLQRIREADTEVRWQHDEDVTECPTCHEQLTPKKKIHCRHCGRIFCGACVCHPVPCGPRRAPARVCAVCRTLLQQHTAPYFSTDPPHTPD